MVVGTLQITGSSSSIALARFNSDGTLDNAFGKGGTVVISMAGTNNSGAQGLAIQSDGKILVAGYSSGDCFADCIQRHFCRPLAALLRLKPNGAIDSTFGQNGHIVFGLGSFNSGIARTILIQPDGKIIALGDVQTYFCESCSGGTVNNSGIFIVRYLPNGMPDNNFGLNGTMVYQELKNYSTALLQSDGRIVIASSTSQGNLLIRRHNNDGSVNPTFYESIFSDNLITDMVLLPNGKLALGGILQLTTVGEFFVVRSKNNGGLDSSFNGTGRLYFQLESSYTPMKALPVWHCRVTTYWLAATPKFLPRMAAINTTR